MNYTEFLDSKTQHGGVNAINAIDLPESLYDFQRCLVEWALQKGRAAIFADCGLGKTPMQLAWAEAVSRHSGGKILIVTPLAVGAQTVSEAVKFGIEASRSRDGFPKASITVTNYEQLHKFRSSDYTGMVCDESSILKNFDGTTRSVVTAFMKDMKYRLLCTATPSPNDYVELGTSSEALGHLGHMDMLGMFFKNDENSLHPMWRDSKWRFKPHAEHPFWQWLCSWARALRKPSDLGFSDERFKLPELHHTQHIVQASRPLNGKLFATPAIGLSEQREERRATIIQRCERAASLLDGSEPGIAWCHLNAEGDLLEQMISGSVQVSGKDDDEEKENKLTAFSAGEIRVIVTKPTIAGFGLNWQHCARMTMFPSHSFEQYYQAIRRCWRFGQHQPVEVSVISTEGEANVLGNLMEKAHAADRMFERIVSCMNEELRIDRAGYGTITVEVPAWLS